MSTTDSGEGLTQDASAENMLKRMFMYMYICVLYQWCSRVTDDARALHAFFIYFIFFFVFFFFFVLFFFFLFVFFFVFLFCFFLFFFLGGGGSGWGQAGGRLGGMHALLP